MATWLVYRVPGTDTPIGWRIDGNPVDVIGQRGTTRTLTSEQAAREGMLRMGVHTDLVDRGEHPFKTFVEDMREQSLTEPWLKNKEVLIQAAEAYLEGRDPTLNDMRQTEWFNSRTQKQRNWLAFVAQEGPTGTKQRREDARLSMRNSLMAAGVSKPPEKLVNYMATMDLNGSWSDAETAEYVRGVGDPYAKVKLPKWIRNFLHDRGGLINTVAADTRAVEETARRWLGPFADRYTEKQYRKWAGMLRNDPNGANRVEEIFKGQRMAMLPEYTNPDVTWEDAARPWQAYLSQTWGEEIEEDDPVLMQAVRANDINEAGRIARREGVKRGVGGAVDEVTSAMTDAFGGGVRRSI